MENSFQINYLHNIKIQRTKITKEMHLQNFFRKKIIYAQLIAIFKLGI
jgi:hypothetical protein